jgi:ArsR family transcriptional regulator
MSGETTGIESGAAGTDGRVTGTGGCCETVPTVDPERVAADVSVLSAMGNGTRYRLLRLIAGTEGGEVCVCELEAGVEVGQSAVSQALSRLQAAGLVERRKEGSWRYYRTTPDADHLLAALDTLGDRDE